MPLESINIMARRAISGGYALGYFESWDLPSLQGTIDAAEETRSPVILGFNGEFLSRPERIAQERLAVYAALGRAAAESASVACGLLFNECPRDDWVRAAIGLGFNMVMPVAGDDSLANYTRRVSALTQLAHERGVAVEAELGELPMGGRDAPGSPTDPDQAARFVETTGVDLLAVSVGNVHVLVRGQENLDLERLDAIHRRAPVPLALHGGTGIAEASLKEAITRGVAKVNFGTYLKQRYLEAVRANLCDQVPDPHKLLGLGGPEDVLVAARLAVRLAVLERIHWLGCCGRG
jgi:fructose/tagatose bisphosphate aldolase